MDWLFLNTHPMMDWLLLSTLVALGTGLRWLLGPLFGALVMGGAVGTGVWFASAWNGLGLESIAIGIAAGVIAFIFVLVGVVNWIGMVLHIVLQMALGGIGGSLGGIGGSRGGRFSGGGGRSGGAGASGRW
jgi:uncharacterized protein